MGGTHERLATGSKRSRHSAVAALDTTVRGLSSLPTGGVDAVISHAVLEHVVDVEKTCRELARVTRPRGVHIHQIDYRDHRDQARPLDHLLIPEAEFMAKLASVHWNTGNRHRHSEFCALFDAIGFDLIETLLDPEVERPLAPYLPHFLPLLRSSQSRYRDWPKEKLGPLGARLTLRKRARMGFTLIWAARLWTEHIRAKIPARIGIVRGRPINRPARDQETPLTHRANLLRRGSAGPEQPIVLP